MVVELFDCSGCSDGSIERGSFTTARGSCTFERGTSAFGLGSSAFGRGTSAFGRGSSAFGRGGFTFERGSSAFGRGASAFGRGSLPEKLGGGDCHRPSSFMYSRSFLICSSSVFQFLPWRAYSWARVVVLFLRDNS